MSNRKVIVTPFELGYIDEVNRAFFNNNANPGIISAGLFYASMIQAGVENFEIYGPAPISEFLQKRISVRPEDEWAKKALKIFNLFRNFRPDSYNDKNKYIIEVQVECFLIALMIALERKASLVLTSPLPDPLILEDVFYPQFLIPFKNLMKTIVSENANSPFPKDFILPDNFFKFQDIICSDLFSHYSYSHEKLENNLISQTNAIDEIRLSGQKLVENNLNFLRLKNLAISLIPLSSKIIDTVFGKLPGEIADFFAQHLSAWLKNDRRVVIYRFDSVLRDLFYLRFRSLMNK